MNQIHCEGYCYKRNKNCMDTNSVGCSAFDSAFLKYKYYLSTIQSHNIKNSIHLYFYIHTCIFHDFLCSPYSLCIHFIHVKLLDCQEGRISSFRSSKGGIFCKLLICYIFSSFRWINNNNKSCQKTTKFAEMQPN